MQIHLLLLLIVMKLDVQKFIATQIVLILMRYFFVVHTPLKFLKHISLTSFSVFCVRSKNNFRVFIKKEYSIDGYSAFKYFKENSYSGGTECQFIKHMGSKL